MNANMKIVRDWIITQNYESALIELEGEYETVPKAVYEAYYNLSNLEKLKVFRNAVNHIIKNY
ncbi:hypothetical protein ACMGD3_24295 [Lysinibacillus sphaericus]|uniref:hypothetical protein n=1 Tax=Lysinibacillus sphaericus TaxID=1421 RepID=UPI003F7AE509